jgi:hypothetical protein
MKKTPLIISTLLYAVCVFLADNFLLFRERTVGRNIRSAVFSGVFFLVFMALFKRYKDRKKTSTSN